MQEPTYNYNQTGTSTNMGDWNPAVAQLQQQLNAKGANLNVDGKYGPLTDAANKQFGAAQGSTQTTGMSTRDLLTNYWGVAANILSKYSDSQLDLAFGPPAQYLKNRATAGQQSDAINSQNFYKAYQDASNDPTIQAQYGDELAIDKSGLQQTLNNLNTLYGVQQQNNEITFRKDQNTLNENEAGSGLAYSGFRGQAQKDLTTEQQGVITSQKADQQKQIYGIGSALESAYGSNGLNQFGNIGYGGQNYNPVGGVVGQLPVQKENDVINKAGAIYKNLSYPTLS